MVDLPPIEESYDVRATDKKGMGMFATRDIKAGEYVIIEKCGLWRQEGGTKRMSLRNLIENFDALPLETQARILRLHAWYDPRAIVMYRDFLNFLNDDGSRYSLEQSNRYIHLALIFRANNFELYPRHRQRDGTIAPARSGIFIQASRFNHSCDPNVYWNIGLIPGYFLGIATRNIGRDEELTISYITPRPPRQERRADLDTSWGFLCQCDMCMGEDSLYDQQLEEALELQRSVAEQEKTGGIEQYILQEELDRAQQEGVLDEDESFRTRLERRCEIVDELGWLPEQFFSHYDAAVYYNYRVFRLRMQDEDDTETMNRAFMHINEASRTGEEIWGPYDVKTAAARNYRKNMFDGLVKPPEQSEDIF